MKSLFTPKEVAKIVGISYRQIQYWDKTNFVKPSYRRRGKYRLYTCSDLLQLEFAKALRSGFYSIQRLRAMMKDFRSMLARMTFPLFDLVAIVDGKRLLVFGGDVLMSCEEGIVRFSARQVYEKIERLFPDEYAVSDRDALPIAS